MKLPNIHTKGLNEQSGDRNHGVPPRAVFLDPSTSHQIQHNEMDMTIAPALASGRVGVDEDNPY